MLQKRWRLHDETTVAPSHPQRTTSQQQRGFAGHPVGYHAHAGRTTGNASDAADASCKLPQHGAGVEVGFFRHQEKSTFAVASLRS